MSEVGLGVEVAEVFFGVERLPLDFRVNVLQLHFRVNMVKRVFDRLVLGRGYRLRWPGSRRWGRSACGGW